MVTIAFMSTKGGTGKTTVACWLGAAYTAIGKSVAVVDADPARSALAWAKLAGSMPFPVYGIASPDLRERLAQLRDKPDVLLLDVGQMENHAQIARSAILAADEIVIPVAPSGIELDRTGPIRRRITEVRPQPPRVSALLNRCVTNAISVGETRDALTAAGWQVLTAQVGRRERYTTSFGMSELPTSGTEFEALAYELLARGI